MIHRPIRSRLNAATQHTTLALLALLVGCESSDLIDARPVETIEAAALESGTTFFLADAERTNIAGWDTWHYVTAGPTGAPTPTISSVRAKSGTRSYRYEIPAANAAGGHGTQTLGGSPQTSMGDPGGRFMSGYYSWWTYVDEGFADENTWNMLMGWMTGKTGAPNPISHLELRPVRGVLQIMYVLKNCAQIPNYPCPTFAGYEQPSRGYYAMTAQSPAGIKPFPRKQWVHLSAYYKMSPTNGQVTVWQDGVKIMDLTHPTMNTSYGSGTDGTGRYSFSNPTNNMFLQFGIYGQYKTGRQVMYVDDFMVTDFRPVP